MQSTRGCTMDASSSYYAFCLLVALVSHVLLRAWLGLAGKKTKPPPPRLPPGPRQLPVIGSFHHLLRGGGVPHRAMRDLSRRHGPVMLLRLCERAAVVVSSADAAREVLRDAAFEPRPGPGELVRHGEGVIFAPYGDHWRLLRRVLVAELLSARRVAAFRRVREEEAARLVASLASPPAPAAQPVDVGERLEEFVADSAVRAIFGERLPDRGAFLAMLRRGQDLSAVFGLRDLFPSSRLVRMLPRSAKAERYTQELLRLVDEIRRCHEERRAAAAAAAGDGDEEDKQDMIDVLLRIQKEGDMRVSLTNEVIRAVLIGMCSAQHSKHQRPLCSGPWPNNPRVMEKAQSEIRHAMAGQARVHEQILGDLHYLKAVIKETLRLHPPITMFPRQCQNDTKIQGYDIPEGTIVVINAWSISRDLKYWKDPDIFKPERFEAECSFDYKGFDYEFIPFGAGRRMCPGVAFSNANVEIALASLLYHFDWTAEKLDMTEAIGMTTKRKAGLFLKPILRIPLVDE
ncbi:hypothetical protein ACP4OV_009550 [Aristida adscensionis]